MLRTEVSLTEGKQLKICRTLCDRTPEDGDKHSPTTFY